MKTSYKTSSNANVAQQCSKECKNVAGLKLTSYLSLIVSLVLLACQPTGAILNCFTPNMFKMGKAGQSTGAYGDSNYYPQSVYQAGASGYPGQHFGFAGHQNPMKYLFQPKWKAGTSLFGGGGGGGGGGFGSSNKFGWNSWRMGNHFRPGFGAYGGVTSPVLSGPTVGYPFSEQLNLHPAFGAHAGGSYQAQVSHLNDGWSAPVSYSNQAVAIQQSPVSSYDGVYAGNKLQSPSAALVQPNKQQQQQIAPGDPYGGTKGGGNKNLLLADGTGYGIYNPQIALNNLKNITYGYTYPDWYTGVMESPSKIAQQLMKYGLKNQRQELRNRSLPLVLQTVDQRQPSSSSFTILDKPRFVGFGTVEELNNREARLSCSFNEAIDQTNHPLWIKFQGPYNSSQTINNKVVPPFNCANSQCRTLEIESFKDFRYKFDNGPATSTLIISEPRLADYGIYRCSALTKAINDNPLETVYQVIRFGSLK